jgi:hypothetical protein
MGPPPPPALTALRQLPAVQSTNLSHCNHLLAPPAEEARVIFLLELPPEAQNLQEEGGSKAGPDCRDDPEAGGDDSSDYGDFWSAAATQVIPVLELGDEESFDTPLPWLDNSFAEPTQSMLQQIRGLGPSTASLGGPSASSIGAPPVEDTATLLLPHEGAEDEAAPDGGAAASSSSARRSRLQPRAPASAGGPSIRGQLQHTAGPSGLGADQGDGSASPCTSASGRSQRQLSWQRSNSTASRQLQLQTQPSESFLTKQLRPTRLTQDHMLRLLAEAYGKMVLSPADHANVELTDAQLEVWLKQLLRLTRRKSDTVLALYGALKKQHPWMKLGDVYSALVYLRDKFLGKGDAGQQGEPLEPGEGGQQRRRESSEV